MRGPPLLALLVLGCAFAPPLARGETLTLIPTRDTTIYEESPDFSNGQGAYLFVGETGVGAGFSVRRALLRFDLSAIPSGSTITSVSLSLHLSKAPSGAVSLPITVHQVSKDWGESATNGGSNAGTNGGGGVQAKAGDATWSHRFYSTSTWAMPGGEFDPIASATRNVGRVIDGASNDFVWSGAGLVGDVQEWVNSPSANFGWIMIGQEGTALSARRFDSGEFTGSGGAAPKLTVIYSVPEPSSAMLAALAAGALVTARRWRRHVTV